MIRSDKDIVEIRGYSLTIHCEFAQLAHAMIAKGVATPEELKEFIDIANETIKEKKAEVIDLSEKIGSVESIIDKAVKEIVAAWTKQEDNK